MSVLIAEDDDQARQLLHDLFAQSGFRVTTAANGAQALSALNREIPNLVVLDLVLPWVNGIEVLMNIRNTLGLERMPVLVVTGTATTERELRTFGPLTVMRKPFDVEGVVPTALKMLASTGDAR